MRYIGELYKFFPNIVRFNCYCDPFIIRCWVNIMRRYSRVVVALGYRLNTIGVAMVGAIVYWFSKREVDEVLSQGEEAAGSEVK